jgi:hypothetical protein
MRAVDRSGIITVRLDGDRELLFRFLIVKDEKFLSSLVEEDPTPRSFALQVLNNQLLNTSPTQPADLDSTDLASAAFSWADQDCSLGQTTSDQQQSLEVFKQRIVLHVAETEEALRKLSKRLYPHIERSLAEMRRAATAFSPAVLQRIDELVWPPDHVTRAIQETITIPNEQFAAIGRALSSPALRAAVLAVEEQGRLIRELSAAASRQIEAISRSLSVAIPTYDLVRELPSAQEIVKAWERHKLAVAKGEKALDEEGFSFARSLVGVDLAVRLAQVPNQVRGAQTTNRLLAFTKSEPFRLALEDRVTCSEVAKRRWHIIEKALGAHSSRTYVLSVPALFAQVEGLFTDSMIMNGLAEIRNSRLYALDSAGIPKLDKNGNRVRLTGLGSKTQHSPYQNHPILSEIVGALVQSLTGKRNSVLHGSETSYGKAKLSTQLMLLVFILATEILAFEQATVSP